MDKQDATISLESKIAQWLQTQGYVLELECASAFAKAGFSVSLVNAYDDPESGGVREIDIIARYPDYLGGMEFCIVIECKHSPKHPWVLFTSGHSVDGFSRFFSHSINSASAREVLAAKTHTDDVLSLPWMKYTGLEGVGLVAAFKERNEDIGFKAVLSAIKACIDMVQRHSKQSSKPFVFCVPVVIFSNSLFDCHLDESGNVRVSKVDGGGVFIEYPIGEFPGGFVHIVPFHQLSKFASEAWQAADAMYKLLLADIKSKIKGI